MRQHRSFRKSEDGATLVEFALVAGIFVVFLIAIVDFGLVFWQKSMVTAAARDGARYAIVRGSDSGRDADSAGVSAYVRGRTDLAPIRVMTTWPTGKDPGDIVNVRVEYTHWLASPILAFAMADSIVLSSTSRVVITF